MVWVLTIASICIAGGGLLVNRIVMANAIAQRELSLGVHSLVLGITDGFSDQLDGIDRTMTKMIETDTVEDIAIKPAIDLDTALAPLLGQISPDSEAARGLKRLHAEYRESLEVLATDAATLKKWHVERALSHTAKVRAEQTVKDQIQKMRAKITTLLGQERLKRITMLASFRKAPDAERLALANGLFSQGDGVAAAAPIERELADLLVIVEQLLAAQQADVARDLVNNQLSQSLQRVQRLIRTADAKLKDSATLDESDIQTLVAALLGSGGRLDSDSQSIVRGEGGLLSAIDLERTLNSWSDTFRATAREHLAEARGSVSRFAESADKETASLLAISNSISVNAWKQIGLITTAGAVAILILGAAIARSIKRQAVELQTSNEKLDRASVLAEAASRAKSDFLANMSHEIRTPMTAILGYADLLADPSHSEAEKSDHVRTIRRNGEHLLSIINDILDLSKIEAGKMTLEVIDTNVIQIAEEVVSLVRPRAIAKSLSVESTIVYPFPATIKTDPLRLRQVLMNLAGNAVKFTQSGGIRLHASFLKDRIRFEVIDTGIGMSEAQADKIFRPFTQADETMSRRFGGTGLGLAISQRLMTLMGSSIQCSSQSGVGTTFWFDLPIGDTSASELILKEAKSNHIQRPATKALATLSGIHVVLAEDGPDNQRLFSFHLRKAGARVDIVGNGCLAVEHLTKLRDTNALPHVILMDMQMPEMDGYDASRELRRLGITTPIIALTAHAMAGDREKCIRAGCTDYLTKPIDRAVLISTIANLNNPNKAAA